MRNLSSKVVLCAALVVLGAAPARAFDLQSGIGFVAITNSVEDTEYVLRDAQNQEVGRALADRFGSLVFRDLVQGASYTVAETGGGTQPVTIRRFEDHPAQGFYDAHPPLVAGLNYIQTRDGTLLAAMVRPPLGESFNSGRRFPTVIEYSGYAAADPNNPQPSTLLAQVLGFATVGINMRGSGCSGGVIDLFDLPTTADGYDAVETVAVQDWVAREKVGMIGISFPGISQLFVAGAQPPHLAAVAPFSVIGDIYRSPGFPGGIFNNGFAETWLQERADEAEPAPEGGQQWAIDRVNNGDTVCEANQKLRLQTQDPVDFTESEPYYTPVLMDNRSPINWVSDISVPILLSGAWQDEQTGSGFATLLRHLPKGKTTKIHLTNGVHSSPLEPEGLWTWIAFLDIYVAGRGPEPARLAPFAQSIYSQIWGPGHPTPPLPPDRFAQYNSAAEARAAFEAEPRVRVLMENGAGSPDPGIPAPTFELTFSKWPAPGTRERFLTKEEFKRLGAALTKAETEGLPPAPQHRRKSGKEAKQKHRPKSADTPIPANPFAVAAIRLLALTGCRENEVLSLRWDAVDLERGYLRLADTKTGRSVRPIGQSAAAILEALPRIEANPFVFPGLKETEHLKEIKRLWYAARYAAKLDGLRLHDLRHSFASVPATSGESLLVVRSLLGHKRVSTTERYAHLSDDPVKRAANRASSDIASWLGTTNNAADVEEDEGAQSPKS